jgi:DNA-binding IclR family transcriptional regulator
MSSRGEAWHVGQTLRMLELLAFAPLSAPQLADAMGSHPRTVRRVLDRLRADGWLTCSQDRRRVYTHTLRLAALAGQVIDRFDLARLGRPYVALLHERTGTTAHLVVPSYGSVVCVCHASSGGDERPHLREVVPAHCTAGGKALLAYREPWAESILAEPLERHTPDTLTLSRALAANLAKVRDRGHAAEDGEYQQGVRAVAAPVFVGTEAVAAVSVSGQKLAVHDVVAHVAKTAQQLGLDLARGDAH